MMNYKDLTSKLLATENITVVRGNDSTASFNIESRILTLPTWKDVSSNVEDMLIGHEVGHALYTSNKYVKKIENDITLHSYMNVIEDVRIEKAIQNEYPGLKKTFITAYKELQDKDFFGVKGKDLSKLQLIDRINLYYKAGYNCGVKFTNEELKYVHAVDNCKTIDDVFKLANQIIDFAKIERQKKQKAIEILKAQFGDDDNKADDLIDNPFESALLEDIESELGGESKAKFEQEQKREEPLTSITQKNLDDQLKSLADTSVKFIPVEYTVGSMRNRNPIRPYSNFFETVDKYVNSIMTSNPADTYPKEYIQKHITAGIEDGNKFLQDCKKEVNYLIKEFEMRKSANQYYKTKIHKTGQLDIKKLYAYKIKEELFKSIEVLPKGKNHGMIMLLDWSGSMSNCLHDVIKQTIILSLFCHQANIPFQVFAFTNGTEDTEQFKKFKELRTNELDSLKNKGIDTSKFDLGWFELIELFSSKMSKKDLIRMVQLLMSKPYQWVPEYHLASTPLNESLYYMIDYLPKFRNNFKVEKMTFITLTDGEGHSIQPINWTSSTYDPKNGQMIKNKLFISYKNKKYVMNAYSRSNENQTSQLIRLLKDTNPGLVTLSFNIIGWGTSRNIARSTTINSLLDENMSMDEQVLMIKQQIKEQNCAILKNVAGFDEYYILVSNKMNIENVSLDKMLDSAKVKTNHQIAKSFTQMLKTNRTSRVLLNCFASKVA